MMLPCVHCSPVILEQSRQGLASSGLYDGTRLVIWPESPMKLPVLTRPAASKRRLRLCSNQSHLIAAQFPRTAANEGGYNSAILVNEEGRIAAQYDKIRLMPFWRVRAAARWLPGSGSVRSIVGEIYAGSSYTLMPLGAFRVGVLFVLRQCIRPSRARSQTPARMCCKYFERRLPGTDASDATTPGQCDLSRGGEQSGFDSRDEYGDQRLHHQRRQGPGRDARLSTNGENLGSQQVNRLDLLFATRRRFCLCPAR